LAKKYPAIFALPAVVTGIVLADNIDIASWIYLFAALSFLPLLIVCYSRQHLLKAGLCGLAVLLLLSAFNFSFRVKTFPPAHVVHYADKDKICTFYGTVDDWPVPGENLTSIYISVDSVACEGICRRSLGRILLRINTETTAVSYGDRIYFDARLYLIRGGKNPAGLDYKRYLNLKSVFGVCYLPNQFTLQIDTPGSGHFYSVINRIRGAVIDVFNQSLSEDASSMAAGFLIGYTRDISPDIYSLFRDSGTLHLLAVSGSNVGLVVVLFVFLLRASPIKPGGRTVLLLMIIIVFSFLAYNQPSVVRASVMASLVLIGRFLQRKVELNNIIAATALIILLFRPADLFDIGFQLSFITAWGLIFFIPRVIKPLKPIQGSWYYKYLIFPFLICFVAQVVSMPLSIYYFQRLPLVSFVSNLIIVPLVSVVVIGELILLIAYLILPYLGLWAGSILNLLIHATLALLRIFGSGETGLLFKQNIPGIALCVYYAFLVIISLALYSRRLRRVAVLFALLTANLILITGGGRAEKDRCFTVLSVPGGIVSVNRAGTTQMILSDLTLKDYSITERIIGPYLESQNIAPDKIFVLSTGYQCMKECNYILNIFDSAFLYIPSTAVNIFSDVCRADDRRDYGAQVITYDEMFQQVNRGDEGAVVSGRSLIYNFGFSGLIFAGNDCDFEIIQESIPPDYHGCVLVKARIDEKDLDQFVSGNPEKWRYIVCNRVTAAAARAIDGERYKQSPLPELVETSQVGAVDLIFENGEFHIKK